MRALFNGVVLIVLTGFWSSVAVLTLPFMSMGVGTWIARQWGREVTWLCGVKLDVIGALPEGRSYVVLANHTSHFDVICIFARLKLDMRPVAKRELRFIPVFGWALALGAAIMIDRQSRAKAKASIDNAAKTIRKGRSVLMFPEGTRTPPGTIGPLKQGPFHLAAASQVPILPIGVIGTGAVLLPGDWKIHPGRVTLVVGTPIPTAGCGNDKADRTLLLEKVQTALTDLTKGG